MKYMINYMKYLDQLIKMGEYSVELTQFIKSIDGYVGHDISRGSMLSQVFTESARLPTSLSQRTDPV